VYPNARDWRIAQRPNATIFSTVDDAQTAIEVISANPDIKAVGGRVELEPVTSFDPDWCIAPGVHMRENMERLGVTPEQFLQAIGAEAPTILAGDSSYGDDVAGKLAGLLGGTTGYWKALNENYQEGVRKGLHVTK